jgi:hypothetical protein
MNMVLEGARGLPADLRLLVVEQPQELVHALRA